MADINQYGFAMKPDFGVYDRQVRSQAAIAAMHALVSKQGCRSAKITAQDAIEYADALIAELAK